MPKMTWDEWINAVEKACYSLCGMSHHDLPDMPYRDYYDEGKSPAVAARSAIKSAKEY